MSLFFCLFTDSNSLIVDADSEPKARELARKLVEVTPSRVIPIASGAFACEVEWATVNGDGDPEDPAVDDVEFLSLEPLPHTAELLEFLDDSDPDAPVDAPAEVFEPATHERRQCLAEADGDGGKVYRCHLDEGHLDEHQAYDGQSLVVWEP